jgi:hypothetical protein
MIKELMLGALFACTGVPETETKMPVTESAVYVLPEYAVLEVPRRPVQKYPVWSPAAIETGRHNIERVPYQLLGKQTSLSTEWIVVSTGHVK